MSLLMVKRSDVKEMDKSTSNTKKQFMTNAQRQRNWRDRRNLEEKLRAQERDRERKAQWILQMTVEQKELYLKKERERKAKSRAKQKEFKQATAKQSNGNESVWDWVICNRYGHLIRKYLH